MALIAETELYTQTVYRACLDVISRPGTIARLGQPGSLPRLHILSPYLAGLALTLLDNEVSYHIHHGAEPDFSFMEMYTMSKRTDAHQCDYLFTDGEQLSRISHLRKGELQFPDRSCTVLCSIREINDKPFAASTAYLRLTGPGIRNENVLYVQGLSKEILTEWREANSEFPLGIDWFLVDDQGHFCAIPRSTRMDWSTAE